MTRKLLSLDQIPQVTTTRGQARPFACAAQARLPAPALTCLYTLAPLTHIPQATTARGQARPFACAAQVETVDV